MSNMGKPYTGDRNLLIGFIIFVVFFVTWMTYLQVETNKNESTSGIAEFKARHYKVAIQKLNEYTKNNPCSAKRIMGQSEVAQEYLGRAYLRDHQYQKAIDALRSPCVFNSENVYYIGIALMKEGQLQEARAEFRKCIDMSNGTSKNGKYGWVEASDERIKEIDKIR